MRNNEGLIFLQYGLSERTSRLEPPPTSGIQLHLTASIKDQKLQRQPRQNHTVTHETQFPFSKRQLKRIQQWANTTGPTVTDHTTMPDTSSKFVSWLFPKFPQPEHLIQRTWTERSSPKYHSKIRLLHILPHPPGDDDSPTSVGVAKCGGAPSSCGPLLL